MAASTEESPAPAAAANTTMATEVTETVKEVITAPAPVAEPEAVKNKEEETKADNGPVAESSPSLEPQGASFKEESYFVSDLKESEKKALQELKLRVEEALKNNEFTEPPPKEPEAKEAEAAEAKEGIKEESKEEGAKETETKGEEDNKTPETKEEEVKGTVEDVKAVETITEIDSKVGEEEVKIEETVVTVTEKIEVPAHGDVPKHEETVVVSETVTESVVADSAPLAETSVVDAAETPVEDTVTKETVEVELQPVEDIYLWGVPLLHTHGDERTDVILLKFLRARDFKVSEAFTMLKNTILWRKRFGADSILEEDFGTEYDGVAYMHGYDKEGHPVCYNVYGVFQDKETYQKSFGDVEKCDRFLRWRIQLLEKGIQQLSFKPGGINSMVQITDLKNSPGPGKKNLRQATQKALDIFQDNYPEFVARKIFVNVPWWYAVMYAMISPRKLFVVAAAPMISNVCSKLFVIQPFHFRNVFSTEAHSQTLFSHFASSKLNLSEADIIRMFKVAPQLQKLRSLDTVEQFFHSLKKRGFTELQIANIMRIKPDLVGFTERIFEPKIKVLEDFGFVDQILVKLLGKNPSLLILNPNNQLLPKMEFLKNVFQSQDVFVKALLRAPRLLGLSLEKTLKPSLAFWKGWGFCGAELASFLLVHPAVLSRTSLMPAQVDLIHKISPDKASKMFKYIVAIVAVSRMETIEAKIENIKHCGLSTEETWQLLGAAPLVFYLSRENVSQKMKFLVNDMGLPANYVVKHANLLQISFEKIIRPRCLVWQKIKSINDLDLPLLAVLFMPETRFVSKIIKGHPESKTLLKVYENAISNVSNRTKGSTKT